jgi:ABC-2 type transport system permease protein
MGILFQGTGELFVYAPFEDIFSVFSFEEGLIRFAGASIAMGIGMLTISTIGFTLSCLNMKPATATIITLSVLFVDSIIRGIPYFKTIQPYCLTTNIGQWTYLFEGRIPWEQVAASFLFLGAINGTLLAATFVVFSLRDFKS